MARTTIAVLGVTLVLAGCGSSGGKDSLDGGGMGGAGGAAARGGTTGTAGQAGGATGGADGGACVAATLVQGLSPGTMSWDDNGVPQCASIIETTRISNGSVDALTLVGVTADDDTIEVMVSVPSGTLGGTYTCGSSAPGGPIVTLEVMSTVATGFSQDCSITIEQAGTATEHARGTFSGSATGDGVDTVTAGTFDVVVMPQGG